MRPSEKNNYSSIHSLFFTIDFWDFFWYNERIYLEKIKMKNLNHHDIHEIYSQISQSLNCIECDTPILPHNIQITDIVDNECLFDVCCSKCLAEMTLSAHIEKNPNNVAKTYNKSSQIMHDNIVEEGISDWDVLAIKNELSCFNGSFIETFAR